MSNFYDALVDQYKEASDKSLSDKESVKNEIEKLGMSDSQLESLADEISGIFTKTSKTSLESAFTKKAEDEEEEEDEKEEDSDEDEEDSDEDEEDENGEGAKKQASFKNLYSKLMKMAAEDPETAAAAIAEADAQDNAAIEEEADTVATEETAKQVAEEVAANVAKEVAEEVVEEKLDELTPEEDMQREAAFDEALLALAKNGYTTYDYVTDLVSDEKLAETICDKAEKLAYVSERNVLRVADDLIQSISFKLQ